MHAALTKACRLPSHGCHQLDWQGGLVHTQRHHLPGFCERLDCLQEDLDAQQAALQQPQPRTAAVQAQQTPEHAREPGRAEQRGAELRHTQAQLDVRLQAVAAREAALLRRQVILCGPAGLRVPRTEGQLAVLGLSAAACVGHVLHFMRHAAALPKRSCLQDALQQPASAEQAQHDQHSAAQARAISRLEEREAELRYTQAQLDMQQRSAAVREAALERRQVRAVLVKTDSSTSILAHFSYACSLEGMPCASDIRPAAWQKSHGCITVFLGASAMLTACRLTWRHVKPHTSSSLHRPGIPCESSAAPCKHRRRPCRCSCLLAAVAWHCPDAFQL